MNISLQHLSTLILRLFSIYVAYSFVRTLPIFSINISPDQRMYEIPESFAFALFIASLLLWLAVSVGLWIGAPRLSRWINREGGLRQKGDTNNAQEVAHKDITNDGENDPFMGRERKDEPLTFELGSWTKVQQFAISLLGVWIIIQTIPTLNQVIVNRVRYASVGADYEMSVYTIATVLTLLFGFFLFLGSSGITKLWKWMQEA